MGHPELAKVVVPSSEVKLPFGFIAMFRMINPDPGHHYECTWTWTDSIS